VRVAALPDKEKDQLVKTRKVVEKGLAWARPLYVAHRHLKGDIGLKWDPNFGERNLLSVVFWIEIFLFHLIYLTVCVCECRYFVNLLLNISKKCPQVWFEFELFRCSWLWASPLDDIKDISIPNTKEAKFQTIFFVHPFFLSLSLLTIEQWRVFFVHTYIYPMLIRVRIARV
jgi:hypothetical protein